MSTPPDSTLGDPEQIIADLRRQLAEAHAERNEVLAREREALEYPHGPAFVSRVGDARHYLCHEGVGFRFV